MRKRDAFNKPLLQPLPLTLFLLRKQDITTAFVGGGPLGHFVLVLVSLAIAVESLASDVAHPALSVAKLRDNGGAKSTTRRILCLATLVVFAPNQRNHEMGHPATFPSGPSGDYIELQDVAPARALFCIFRMFLSFPGNFLLGTLTTRSSNDQRTSPAYLTPPRQLVACFPDLTEFAQLCLELGSVTRGQIL